LGGGWGAKHVYGCQMGKEKPKTRASYLSETYYTEKPSLSLMKRGVRPLKTGGFEERGKGNKKTQFFRARGGW